MRGRLGWRRRGGSLGSEQASQMNSAQQDVALLQCLPNTCTVPMFTQYLHCSNVNLLLALFQCLPNTCTVPMFTRDWHCSGIAQGTVCRWIPKIRDTRNACSARAPLCPACRAQLCPARRALHWTAVLVELYTVAEEIIAVPRPALWPRGRGITHTQI